MMHNPRNESALSDLLSRCEKLISKHYFNNIHDYTFCSSDSKEGYIKLLKIEMLREPLSSDFFSFVLNAIGNLREIFGYILQSDQYRLVVYVGLKTTKSSSVAIDILKNGLKNSYPQSNLRELSQEASAFILEKLFDPKAYQALSSVIVVPNNTAEQHAPINQKLVELMENEAFTALFLATPLIQCKLKSFIEELRELYTTLSAFTQTNYDFSHSSSKDASSHITHSITESDSKTCTDTSGQENACNASQYALITSSLTIPFQETRLFNISGAANQASGTANVILQSAAKGEIKACAVTKTDLKINATSTANSESLSYTKENKYVIDCIKKLERLIERLTSASNNSLFCFGAYFLSESSAASIRAAYTYAGLAKDHVLNLEDAFITTWEERDPIFKKLVNEIKHFNHLTFITGHKNECITSCTPITSLELLNSFYFPYAVRTT